LRDREHSPHETAGSRACLKAIVTVPEFAPIASSRGADVVPMHRMQ
jgi:hypothetical protein